MDNFFESIIVNGISYRSLKKEYERNYEQKNCIIYKLFSFNFIFKVNKSLQIVCSEDESCSLDVEKSSKFKIQKDETGFVFKMSVDSSFYGLIIGKGGKNISQLSNSSGCSIKMPRSNENFILIKSKKEENIIKACEAIENLINEKSIFNYFVSIPLNDTFGEISELALKIESLLSVDAIKIDPKKLHFTLLMLSLNNQQQIEQACQIFEKIKPKIISMIKSSPILIDWSGINVFGSFEKAKTIYLEPNFNTTSILNPIIELIIEAFYEAGLITYLQKRDEIILHATLFNTNKSKIDAKKLKLKPFNVEKLKPIELSSIQLSQRHNLDPNGYYHKMSEINL